MEIKKINLTALLVFAVMFLALPMYVSADTYLKQVTFTEGFNMGAQKSPDTYDTASIWYDDGKYRCDMGDGMTILTSADDDIMRLVNHAEKTYNEISISTLGDPKKMLGDAAADPHNVQQLQMIEGMAQMMQMSASIEQTEETKKIGDFNCKKFNMNINMGMAQINMVSWVTDEIKIDYDTFQKIFRLNLSIMPGYEKMIEELSKIKGVSVLTEGSINAMGNKMKTSTELVEASQKDTPDGHYDVPKDYTEVPYKLPQMGQ